MPGMPRINPACTAYWAAKGSQRLEPFTPPGIPDMPGHARHVVRSRLTSAKACTSRAEPGWPSTPGTLISPSSPSARARGLGWRRGSPPTSTRPPTPRKQRAGYLLGRRAHHPELRQRFTDTGSYPPGSMSPFKFVLLRRGLHGEKRGS